MKLRLDSITERLFRKTAMRSQIRLISEASEPLVWSFKIPS